MSSRINLTCPGCHTLIASIPDTPGLTGYIASCKSCGRYATHGEPNDTIRELMATQRRAGMRVVSVRSELLA